MDELLTTKQAAQRLGFSPGTLENWRSSGKGPPWVKISNSIRYSSVELDAWIERNSIRG